jgi:hypothetical protein
MKSRKSAVIGLTVLLGVAVAGLLLYTNYPVKASVPSLPSALRNIPADSQFVFGVNVQKFTASSVYAKLRQRQNQPMGKDLADVIEKTGVDPARDLLYMVAAGRSGAKLKGEGVAIMIGQFHTDSIAAYIRSKASPTEMEYAGSPVMMFPASGSENVGRGITFLNDREIALGDLESLKAVLDIRAKGNKSILLNPAMAHLFNGVSSEEMFWFAADAAGVLSRVPATTPLGASVTSIQSVVGTLDISEAVVGKITVSAVSEDAAMKLADVVRGFVALTQLGGDRNADLKTLLGGLTVAQNATQVSVGLNFPVELLERLERNNQLPKPPAGN